MARLAEAGSIRIGAKFDQPGIGQRNLSGQPEGFDIEIAKMVANALGIEESNIEWVETVAINREPFLQQDKVDIVVANYLVNAERRKAVTFAGPYLTGGLDIVVMAGNPNGINGPEDLAGRPTCMTNGGSSIGVMRRDFPEVNVVAFDVQSKCLEALKNGSVDAISSPNFIMAGYVQREAGTVELLNKPFTHEDYGIGIKKGDVGFCEFVNSVLADAAADGRYEKAWNETLGTFGIAYQELPPADPCE